ncbi:glycosyltransferase family 2 protein [Pelagibacterales bacterium SAG-MED18]|nr:glycosyltransferase family 2 protein [Pelagibacterales bacterium SAG-MED18]
MNLSIIIPHYNSSNFLEKLLLSIPKKKDIQVIIVDDKSELSHLKVIYELKKIYSFDFFQNNRDKGAGSCRNIGLEIAIGKWILFADSDDFFVNNFYHKVSTYFNSLNDVIFFSPTSQYIETGKIAGRHLSFKKKINAYMKNNNKKNEFLLRYTYIVPWSRMIKKEFIKNHKINFDEVRISEDVMFATKVGHFMKKFEVTKDEIYCIVNRSNSFSKITIKEDIFDIWVYMKISYIKFLVENISKEELCKIMKPFIRNKAAEVLFRSFNKFGFKKFFQVYKLFKRENIKCFRLVYLNPIKIIKYIIILCYKKINDR